MTDDVKAENVDDNVDKDANLEKDTGVLPVKFQRPSPQTIALAAAVLIGTIAVFWEAGQSLLRRWGNSEELNHSYFIPVISAGLLYMRRDALLAAIGKSWMPGIIISAVGLVFAIAGYVTEIPLIAQLGLVIFLLGLPGAIWGQKFFLLSLIPMLYLFAMVPPPAMMVTLMSDQFQAMSTDLGVAFIRMLNIPVHNSGNVIDLGVHQLEVVNACSGLRYLFPFMSLGVMAAYLYKGSWWERAIVFFATIPITILCNSLRIAVTAVLVRIRGAEHAEGLSHDIEGFMVFFVCLVMLYAIIWLLSKFVQKRPVADVFGVPEIEPEAPITGQNKFDYKLSSIMSAVVIGGLALTFAAITLLGNKTIYEPDRFQFATFPLEFPAYQSEEKQVETRVANAIGADDFIVTNFFNETMEAPVNVYMAYVSQQREGKSWHSPQQCLPGGGWEFVEHTVEKQPMPDGRIMVYNRIIIKFGDVRQLVYYWYDQRGRMVANEFVVRAWVVADAITKGRKDGAMIRMMTVIRPDETEADAEARINGFLQEMYPVLPKYIPGADSVET